MTAADHHKVGNIFVYGSLKQGEPLYFLEGIRDLRLEIFPARVQGGLLYNLGLFPGMILKSNAGVITSYSIHYTKLYDS